ncbi:MAG TPA: hypothetical protein VFQ42_04240 [Mycobacterium sp.]|nr:hypothetical protein [Mycobacterium sp.]
MTAMPGWLWEIVTDATNPQDVASTLIAAGRLIADGEATPATLVAWGEQIREDS